MPTTGDRKNEIGSSTAMAMVVVKPGSAPMKMPRTRPTLIINSVSSRSSRSMLAMR